MKSTDTYNDIKEVNLSYLMLAQNMVRSDREAAIFRLGISEEIADVIGRLTPGQVLKMASSDMLLCNFRFDDTLLLDLLANHERERGVGHEPNACHGDVLILRDRDHLYDGREIVCSLECRCEGHCR